MKRRELILASGAWGALSAARVRAQPAKSPRRIAYLGLSTEKFAGPMVEVFVLRLKELGYVEGRDIVIDKRWSEGRIDSLPVLARELIALKPEVIIAPSTLGAATFRQATSTLPVVFLAVNDPVAQGFAASFARPGGNMTGTSFRGAAMTEKLIEMIRECLPAVRRIAVLDREDDPTIEKSRAFLRTAFSARGFEPVFFAVRQAGDFERTFSRFAESRVEAIFVSPAPFFASNALKLGELALRARLPMAGIRRAFVEAGGLLSYDNDLREDYRRAAGFVDRIFKGAKPADLPVEQPDRFELVINLRTAKSLGVRIPQPLLLRADEVIE